MDNLDDMHERFKRGDQAALSHYHLKHFAALYNYASSIVKHNAVASDIVVNSFHKLWNNRHKIDKPSNLLPYLYTSCRNECFTYLDKQKRESKHLEKYKYIQDQYDEVRLHNMEAKSLLNERILNEINKLPNRCRMIVKCTLLKQMNNQEIAKFLKISVNTIKNQKSKGIKVLRERLKKEYQANLDFTGSDAVDFYRKNYSR